MIMTVVIEKPWLNAVPAAAVRRWGQALFIINRRKECVGG